MSFIWNLSRLKFLSNLPSGIGRAALITPVYLILQPIRRTARNVATTTGKLLPHLFTLIPQAERLFSVTLLCPREQLPVRKHGALCCPDFPPPEQVRKRQTDLLIDAKVIIFYKNNPDLKQSFFSDN